MKDPNGFRGGPAYYMETALKSRWMGVLFSVLITLCFGLVFNSVQSNTITYAFDEAFGIDRFVMGIIIAALTALVIFGGLKRIARVSEFIVPIYGNCIYACSSICNCDEYPCNPSSYCPHF